MCTHAFTCVLWTNEMKPEDPNNVSFKNEIKLQIDVALQEAVLRSSRAQLEPSSCVLPPRTSYRVVAALQRARFRCGEGRMPGHAFDALPFVMLCLACGLADFCHWESFWCLYSVVFQCDGRTYYPMCCISLRHTPTVIASRPPRASWSSTAGQAPPK